MYVALILVSVATIGSAFEYAHHDTAAVEKLLAETHTKCPEITKVYSIGKSVQNRNLTVIQFASPIQGGHELVRPEFKYVANMHGNEVVGRELLLRLIAELCEGWRRGDDEIRRLLDITSVHLMPSMNPDGYEAAYKGNQEGGEKGENLWLLGRANANGVDLNRNFPDLDTLLFTLREKGVPRFDHLMEVFDDKSKHEPEVVAVARWIMHTPFVLSANLHEGDLVANYPFDLSPDNQVHETKTEDDPTFRYLASSYALAHENMADPDREPCDMSGDDLFGAHGGITNGAGWYPVGGGMQDFNYLASNCFEITLELSCKKFPPADTLSKYWEDNRLSLYNFMWQTHMGIKGVVADEVDGRILPGAVVTVTNITIPEFAEIIEHPVTTGATGDYYRLLTPGAYRVTVQAPGYVTAHRTVIVEQHENGEEALRVDFKLVKNSDAQKLIDLQDGAEIDDDELFHLRPSF